MSVHVKDQIPQKCMVPRSSGDMSYIGETGRTLEVRLREQQRAVKYCNSNNGIAVHANKTMHSILWNESEVLEQEPSLLKRKIKEALYIQEEKHIDHGLHLNSIWGHQDIQQLCHSC